MDKQTAGTDVLGRALLDHARGAACGALMVHNRYGRPEQMPIEVFFRPEKDFSDLEHFALSLCHGRVLDIGAGAGAHSLVLQSAGVAVHAIDHSPGAVRVMKQRGVADAVCENVFHHQGPPYDTLLMLMNGIGLVGGLAGMARALSHFAHLLAPGGQLLFDASDIAYLYHDPGVPKPKNRYYGELAYQYEYCGQKSPWFDWLYIDQHTMASVAQAHGWTFQVLYEDAHDQYLGRLFLASGKELHRPSEH